MQHNISENRIKELDMKQIEELRKLSIEYTKDKSGSATFQISKVHSYACLSADYGK